MIEEAVAKAAAISCPILVKENPRTWDEAIGNLEAFSDEARKARQEQLAEEREASSQVECSAEKHSAETPPAEKSFTEPRTTLPPPPAGYRYIAKVPRLKKCYGWLTLPGAVFKDLHWSLWPPEITVSEVRRSCDFEKTYTALVYEYIEPNPDGDQAVIQETLNLFSLTGFSSTDSSNCPQNWESNVLIDLGDIVCARGYSWSGWYYSMGPYQASNILMDL